MKNQKLLINHLARLSYESAYIKFNNSNIEYIQIDDIVYNDIDGIIGHCNLIAKAVEKVRQYDSIYDHGKHIDPFIIKYHPSWIELRNYCGFNEIEKKATRCTKEKGSETYKKQYQDMFVSLGINAPFDKNLDSELKINYSEFDELFDITYFDYFPSNEGNHPDFIAFKNTFDIIREIHKYRLDCNKQIDINTNYKSVSYYIDKYGFPILTIGKKKNRKKYDLRNEEDAVKFAERINNKNKELKQKVLKK